MRIHHARILIPAGREDEARAFYGGLLGLDPPPWPAERPVFVVGNLEAFRARLEQADVEIKDAPPRGGVRRFHAWDPFGNRLEFLEDAPA